MSLSLEAQRILKILAENDAVLFGTRGGQTPFSILPLSNSQTGGPEWLQPVARSVVDELEASDIIAEDTGVRPAAGESSKNVGYRVSDKGRALFVESDGKPGGFFEAGDNLSN